jgi:hypothetical protein
LLGHEEVDVARRHYEEADAERCCKKADAEGVALGRRPILVQKEEGIASQREKVEKLGCHGF